LAARRTLKAISLKAGRAVSLLLCLSLLATSAPAAPLIFKELASEASLGAGLWFDSSGWSATLREILVGQRRPGAFKEQKQEERDARVARIEVLPGGELTARMGERIRFAAVAFDAEGATVGGVKFKWRVEDIERGRKTRISQSGQFEASARGVFKVVAEGAGHQAQATIKVLEGERRRKPGEQPDVVKDISTHDLPPEVSAKKQRRTKRFEGARRSSEPMFVKASFAPAAAVSPEPAAAAMLPADGWNQDNYYYADDPGNEPGNPPGGPQDGGAGNGNFQITAPVLSLPGRGIDLSLALTYNSRIWSKTSYYEMTFDPDRSWPAPGWSLGFGKMIGMGASGSMLIEPDGTRRGFTGTVTNYGSSIYFTGKTTDGSFIDYYSYTYNGSMSYGYAQLPNGTYIEYGAYGEGALYPTFIRDANGNYVTITYRNNQGPQIATVTDTIGRVVTFNYDGSGLLTSVTAPGIGGGTRVVVELQYSWRSVGYNFTGLTARVRSASFPFLQAIRYPGTGTGYWFGDSDSYSPYGMIAKVSERRGMGTQGSISPGVQTASAAYNYPMDTSTGYPDAPDYTTKTETWEGMDTAPAITSYAIFQNSSPRRVEITYPNNTKSIQYSHNSPGTFLDGLIYNSEMRDASGTLLQGSTVTWQQGAYNSPRPAQVEMTDERGQMKKTQYSYGAVYNQVSEARDYDYGGVTLLRKTVTGYENGASYINNHIFNLPKTVEVYAGDTVTRVSRTDYEYDGQSMVNTPGVIMHAESHNPYAPEYWVEEYCYESCYDYPYDCRPQCDPGYTTSEYNPSTAYRGNVTKVTTYADAANLGGALIETSTYDINGNKATASTSCCEQTSFTYTAATYYAYPVSQSHGSAATPSARNTIAAAYDFNTGSLMSSTDENGRTSQTTYNAGTLRPQAVISATGAQTTYLYDDTLLKVTETTTAAPAEGGAVADKKVKYLNGRGLIRREEALGGAEASPWENSVLDVVETKYDQMGRVWKHSRPYRSGSEQPQMTEYFYDAFGRPVEAVEPDGSRTRAFYNQVERPSSASSGPGETSRIVDPWGRERWSRNDALDRLVEVVEPDPNGDGSVLSANNMVTSYEYDALGNLTLATQGAQQRRFRYDSRGRVTHQKLAESSATLNDAGHYVSAAGVWSEVFSYDSRSNLVSRRDSRGVVTSFDYANDPLNRLHSASYALGAAYDTSAPILPAATITYEYMTSGDVTRVRSVRAAGVSTEEYTYDFEGRMHEQKLTLDSRLSHPTVTNYGYDSLDRLKSVTYPQQYPSSTRKTITHSYDVASRLNGLQVGGVAYASNFIYNADSQTASLNVGTGVGNWKQEKYDYDPITGMLKGQKLLRAGDINQKLLDLSYDYLRPGTTQGRTGQLTKIINELDNSKNRSFDYDALGRLVKATSGATWAQRYVYDRYGNRLSVSSSSNVAASVPAMQQSTGDVELAYTAQRDSLPAFLRGSEPRSVTDATPLSPLAFKPLPPVVTLPTLSVADRDRAGADGIPLNPQETRTSAQTSQPNPTPAPTPKDQEQQSTTTETTQPNMRAPCLDCEGDFNSPPIADPGGPYSGQSGQLIQFDGSYSYDEEGWVTNYFWNFGDGTSGLGMSPTHSYASAGTYNVTLRVRDNSGSYSTYTSTTVTVTNPVPTNNAAFVSQNVPSSMNAGQQYTVSVTMNNSGTKTWTAAEQHRLGSQNPQDNGTWGVGRVDVPASAQSGQSVTFNFTVTAPSTPGTYNFQWRMLQEGVEWFGASTPNVAVTVTQQVMGSCTGAVPCDGLPTLSYDSTTNRINTPGWQYDTAGNQTRVQAAAGGWQRMEYDMAGRLSRVKDDAGNVLASYTYGDSNARLITQEGATRTYYAWVSGSVIAEHTETDGTYSYNSPQWSKTYLYLGGRLLATQTVGSGGERVEYHHPDRLGTRVVTNAHDAGSFEQATLPYGTALNAESTGATNRRFTSYARSLATGLDYAVNRHYDSHQGRFTQPDPLEMGAVHLSDPQSLNLYAYCTNDPVNGSDPSGLWNPFKAIWNGLKAIGRAIVSAVKAVAVAISTVLTNKWVLLSVGIALGVMAGFAFYWAAIEVAEVAAAFLKGGIILAGMSAALITSAFHPGVQKVFQIVGSVLSVVQGGLSAIIGGGTILGTPGWNPNSNSFQSGGVGRRPRRRRGSFPSLTDAAIAALRRFNSPSISSNREYNVSICENPDGSLFYTTPNVADGSIGTNASSTPSPCPGGTTRVGTAHTHAAYDPNFDNENFSPADRRNANNRSLASGNLVPNFVATPSGRIKRFDPAVIANSERGRVTNLKARTPIP
jgi:RHS repeat-associated protein